MLRCTTGSGKTKRPSVLHLRAASQSHQEVYLQDLPGKLLDKFGRKSPTWISLGIPYLKLSFGKTSRDGTDSPTLPVGVHSRKFHHSWFGLILTMWFIAWCKEWPWSKKSQFEAFSSCCCCCCFLLKMFPEKKSISSAHQNISQEVHPERTCKRHIFTRWKSRLSLHQGPSWSVDTFSFIFWCSHQKRNFDAPNKNHL